MSPEQFAFLVGLVFGGLVVLLAVAPSLYPFVCAWKVIQRAESLVQLRLSSDDPLREHVEIAAAFFVKAGMRRRS